MNKKESYQRECGRSKISMPRLTRGRADPPGRRWGILRNYAVRCQMHVRSHPRHQGGYLINGISAIYRRWSERSNHWARICVGVPPSLRTYWFKEVIGHSRSDGQACVIVRVRKCHGSIPHFVDSLLQTLNGTYNQSHHSHASLSASPRPSGYHRHADLCYCQSLLRLYLSPIKHIPGPKLAAATRPYQFYHDAILQGRYLFKIKQGYGLVVRISPEEVHVIDPAFVDVLYGSHNHKRDKRSFFTEVFGVH